VTGMKKLYQGPGIKTLTIFEDLRGKSKEVNELSHKVNELAKKLL